MPIPKVFTAAPTKDRCEAATDSVLVTGASGLVDRAVVEQLVADDRHLVATAHRNVQPRLAGRDVEVRFVDSTDPRQVDALVAEVSFSAIVHLAALIPPQCYAHRALARAVNVDATAALVRAAAALPSPPRLESATGLSG